MLYLNVKNSIRNEAISYLKQGNNEYRNGRFVQAIKYYSKAIDTDSNFKEAYGNRAKAKNKLGDISGYYTDTLKSKFYYLINLFKQLTSWQIFGFLFILFLLNFFISGNKYQDISTPNSHLSNNKFQKVYSSDNNGTNIIYYIPSEFQKDYLTINPSDRVDSYLLNNSTTDNVQIQITKLQSRNTEEFNDKKYAEMIQKAMNKKDDNYSFVKKGLPRMYDDSKIVSLDANLIINGKYFGRRILYYTDENNTNHIEYMYMTIHNKRKYSFFIDFIGNDKNNSNTVALANTIAGTIKFKDILK